MYMVHVALPKRLLNPLKRVQQRPKYTIGDKIELVSMELNHLAAIFHVYAGGLIIIFKKEKLNTFTPLIIF